MKTFRIGLLILLVFVLVGNKVRAEPCSNLSTTEKSGLAKYVKAKFRLPLASEVQISQIKPIPNSCLLNVTFVVAQDNFHVDFVLSSDHQFLFQSLFDTRNDPEQEYIHEDLLNRTVLEQTEAPRLGPNNAKHRLVVFSDFQCPFCREASEHAEVALTSTSDLNLTMTFRHLPLSIPSHTWSYKAAVATACISLQSDSAFWTVHDMLFRSQEEISDNTLDNKILQEIRQNLIKQVSEESYSNCLLSGIGQAIVDQDLKMAHELEVNSTPTYFLDGRRIDGLPPISIVRSMLRDQETLKIKGPLNKTHELPLS
jgi:protein-disulfide isomerase